MAQIHFRPGVRNVLPSAWVIHPETRTKTPPVVAVHGLNRETELMANLLAVQADTSGRSIVLPLFERQSWPRFQRAACPRRSDWALLGLLQVLRAEGWIEAGPPDLSGFSGGAQFAHRFAWLYPAEVARLCLVAPGWWTFPDARGAHPLGIGTEGPIVSVSTFRLRANLARFLDRDVAVMVGALDTLQDENLRQDPAINAQQGLDRVQRARNWAATAIRASRRHGLPPRIRFTLMENCGHSFADCVANGALGAAFVPETHTESSKPDPAAMPGHERLVEVA